MLSVSSKCQKQQLLSFDFADQMTEEAWENNL